MAFCPGACSAQGCSTPFHDARRFDTTHSMCHLYFDTVTTASLSHVCHHHYDDTTPFHATLHHYDYSTFIAFPTSTTGQDYICNGDGRAGPDCNDDGLILGKDRIMAASPATEECRPRQRIVSIGVRQASHGAEAPPHFVRYS